MSRHIAFLRGINVGGSRLVKMQALRKVFASIGFSSVETVIASGNVVFDSSESGGHPLEQKIERALRDELGFEVATFLRTVPELTAVVEKQPFQLGDVESDALVFVGFLRTKPTTTVSKALTALNTDNDQVKVRNREVYWLRRERRKDSQLFAVRLAKVLGSETTMRNMTTVKRIVEKYC
jgi:uncharacterized protein (DUF1697 family)